MRLGWNCMKLTTLVSVLGLSVWAVGCGEPAAPVKPIAPASTNGGEAGSTTGGGTDVPVTPEGDSGAAKPADDKPAEDADKGDKKEEPSADKPADAEKKEEPKADEAKKDEAPAEKKEEEKKDE